MSRPSQSHVTKILVVDDHPIVRLGLRQMLGAEPTLEVCGEADSADLALKLAAELRPDMAIIDLSLAQGTGLELVRALRTVAPDLPVLVLSMHDETLFAERALRAGARGYIMKQEAIAGLIEAVRRVLSGKVYVSERVAQTVLERFREDTTGRGSLLGHLTDRELEVLDLISRGLSTAAIATQLNLSVKTIETYRANIKTKLHLKDATELIRFAATWTERT